MGGLIVLATWFPMPHEEFPVVLLQGLTSVGSGYWEDAGRSPGAAGLVETQIFIRDVGLAQDRCEVYAAYQTHMYIYIYMYIICF